MAKENREPYYIDMNISLEGLQNVPSGVAAPDIFINIAINAITSEGKKKGGLRMDEHSKLYRIRQDLLNAIKTQETIRAKLGYEEFKYLMKMWNQHTPEPQTNEIVMRVWDKLKEAQRKHGEEPQDPAAQEEPSVKVSAEPPAE